MTTVLVALDGTMSSERAIPVARELAVRSFADLALVRSSWDASEGDVAAYLAGVPERFGLEIDTRCIVVHGFPGDAVNALAREIGDAVICLTGHGRSAVGHYLLGGHSETILAHAPVPVVVVGPSVIYEWPRGDHLGLCLDAQSDPAVVAPFSARWAERLGFEVDVLTMRAEDDRPVSRYHEASREQLDDAVQRIRSAGVRARSVVLKEVQPATRIARFASEHRLALLVAAKRHEGAARDLLGSTTMNLIHRSPCPVLIPPHEPIAPPVDPLTDDAVLERDRAG